MFFEFAEHFFKTDSGANSAIRNSDMSFLKLPYSCSIFFWGKLIIFVYNNFSNNEFEYIFVLF